MDSFFALRAEKQEHIINAALTIFGRNGYKKASIADIAGEAGIGKGMVMYYFGSKRNLYLYLTEFCGRLLTAEIKKGIDPDVTDYFDRIKMVSDIKLGMMKKHPAIISFLTSVPHETDKEVVGDLKHYNQSGFANRERMVLEGADLSKLHEDVTPALLDQFFVWASEGMMNELLISGQTDRIEAFVKEYYQMLDLMKKYFYRA